MINYITEVQKTCSSMEGSYYDHGYNSLEDFNESIKNQYANLVLDIDDLSFSIIKQSPYFCMKMRCGLRDGNGNLMSINCNFQFMKMMEIVLIIFKITILDDCTPYWTS